MKLTIVGCAGSTAGPDSAASCYLLEANDDAGRTWRLVLDLGSGAIGPLQKYCDPARVDGVLISHGHPDHCADLGALSILRRYGPAMDEDLPPVPLIGPGGLDRRVAQIAGTPDSVPTSQDSDMSEYDFWHTKAGDAMTIGPFSINAAQAWHPVPALAYRVSAGGKSLVFTGDTDRCDQVDALARGADVLLGEAGWAHREVNPPGIHMSGDQLGAMAVDTGVKTVVVTHIASWVAPEPTMKAVRAHMPDAILAVPGLVHEF